MSLTDNIVSCWQFENGGNLKVDSVGTHDFVTTHGGATQQTGKLGMAARFVASNTDAYEQPSHADFVFGTATDWTIMLWVTMAAATSGTGLVYSILNKSYDTGDTLSNEYNIRWYEGYHRFWLRFTDASASTNTDIFDDGAGTNDGSFAYDTYYQVFAWYEAADNKCRLQRNTLSAEGTPAVSAALTGGILTGTRPLLIGAAGSAGTPSAWDLGDMDEVTMWRRALTSGERTQLWNGGAGLAYPYVTGRMKWPNPLDGLGNYYRGGAS